MITNTNEVNIPCDVDGTLIIYEDEYSPGPGKIELNLYGTKKFVYPHLDHIELVKSYHARGFRVRVHSGNGYQWAEQVVKKLGLEDYVYEVETKSFKYLDDMPIETWAGQRVYLPFRR